MSDSCNFSVLKYSLFMWPPNKRLPCSTVFLTEILNKILLVKDLPAYFTVHSTQGIIQEKDIGITIKGPGQTDPCFLAPTEGHPSLSYHSEVPIREYTQILSTEKRIELKETCHIYQPAIQTNKMSDCIDYWKYMD